MLPIVVTMGITTLAYAYGNYRQVLIIGLATNIPRAVLYIILVPFSDGLIGAAWSYTIGSIAGFLLSIVVARKIGLKIFWKDVAFILGIPAGLGLLLNSFHVGFIVGILATLAGSYILLLKMHILERRDVEDSLQVLPQGISNHILLLLDTVGRKLSKAR